MPLFIRQSSVTCGYFLLWKNWLAPAHETSKTGHTENFKPILALALLPSDPVITAHTRHQHYYSSNHSIIIPQCTSKRQLTFQGKNKNSWIMHYEGLNEPSKAAEAQFLLSGARPKLDHQDLCWCNLKIDFIWLLKLSRPVVWALLPACILHLQCGTYFTCNNRIMHQPSVSLDSEVNLQGTDD